MVPSRNVKSTMTTSLFYSYFAVTVIILHCASFVAGHGRLIEPPSRSSMWRFGFKTKPNYNDNELFCGGYTVQWQRNGGRCGVCGDAWDAPKPRPNEAGGIYGRGIISRHYKLGQVIKATVELTANHRGFFEFKLCPHNNPSTEVTQDCLDSYPLEVAEGTGSKYYAPPGTGPMNVHLRLPHHVSCSQCVFQWTYTAGNNWGRCENGTSKVGCGPQETFRGCADVAIGDVETNDVNINAERPPEKPSISAIPTRRTTLRPRYRPRPRVSTFRPSTRRPYYNRRPVTTRKPYSRPSRPTRPTQYYNVPSRRYPSRRPTFVARQTTYRPIYTPRSTPYRPIYTKISVTKKPRPSYKTKIIPKKTTNIETEGNGGGKCRAVGVWQSISGIASWCDTNCARGYCPSSHCDCS